MRYIPLHYGHDNEKSFSVHWKQSLNLVQISTVSITVPKEDLSIRQPKLSYYINQDENNSLNKSEYNSFGNAQK